MNVYFNSKAKETGSSLWLGPFFVRSEVNDKTGLSEEALISFKFEYAHKTELKENNSRRISYCKRYV